AGSGAEPLAALGATAGEHLTTVLGSHAGAEAVATLPDDAARLIGTLHCRFPRATGARPSVYDLFRGEHPSIPEANPAGVPERPTHEATGLSGSRLDGMFLSCGLIRSVPQEVNESSPGVAVRLACHSPVMRPLARLKIG